MEILAGAHQNNKQGFIAHSLVSKLDQIYIFCHYSRIRRSSILFALAKIILIT